MRFVIEQRLYMTSLVEVVYAPTHAPLFYQFCPFVAGMTVSDLLTQSDILKNHPEVEAMAVGVFAKQVSKDTLLKPGDRVEIYRPLICDPKERRRARAHGFEKKNNK
jgi:putative ubiquitin-RnfH superfamily antitoxin RatB of RatAB toxin-antitoxin module